MLTRSRILALGLAFIAAFAAIPPLFAGGEGTKQNADGLENWTTTVDLQGKKAGKYNILITGRDRAGNYSFAGPINIYVDPNSDLPVVSITNPVPLMRVGGDLNVVGTCVDDDAVDYVEVRIDGEEWIRAEGKEYWSYYLSGKTLPDGRHTVAVRGVDINGKAGKERSVQFDLDRNKPYSLVDSHAAGVLVSGKVKLAGVTQDANGVNQLFYSTDNGATFEKLSFSPTKAKDGFTFEFQLDTSKREDGPFVIWFKSVDRTGSTGISPFLLFVDNTKPVVELLSPKEDAAVNGSFQAAFRAQDTVGLTEISWKFGSDQSGTLEFHPGNPFFSVKLKAPAGKSEKVPFVVTAKDNAGNVTAMSAPIKVDNAADLPVVTLASPAANAASSGRLRISGKARDDDGVSAVRYRIDAGQAVDVPSTGSFAFDLEGVAVGKHAVSVSAVDIEGREGLPVKVEFTESGTPPVIAFRSLTQAGPDKKASTEPFRAGMEAVPGTGTAILGAVTTKAKIAKLSYELSGGGTGSLSVAKTQDDVAFAIPLPPAGPYGLMEVGLTAVDEFGRESKARTLVYLTDLSSIRREPAFDLADPRAREDGRVVMGMDKPVELCFVGEEIEDAVLSPASSVVALERDGSVLTIRALKEGATAPTSIKVTTAKRHSFSSKAWTFVTDDKPPQPAIDSPAQGGVFSSSFAVKGSASDGNGIASVTYRVWPSGEKIAVKGGGTAFEFRPDFASLPEGPIFIEVEALDSAGNPGSIILALAKDTTAPSLQTLTPVEAVDAAVTVAGVARDPSGVASVEFAENGTSFEPLSEEGFFSHSYNPVQSPNAKYRLTDKAGNKAIADVPHFLNPAPLVKPPKGPAITILSPLPNSQAGADVYASVRIVSDAGLASASWTFDAQKGTLDPAAGPVWVLKLPAAGIKAKSAVFKVQATDVSKGTTAAQSTVVVSQAALAPAAPFHAFAAKAVADAGTASVSYAIDAGAFAQVQGSVAGALVQGLGPGTHTLSVKAVAASGVESAVVKRTFRVSGNGPSVSASLASGKEAPRPLRPGMAFTARDARLSGSASFPNGIGSLSAKLESGADLKPTLKKISATEASFETLLPAGLPYDRVGIVVTAKDALGVETTENLFFHNVAPAATASKEEGIRALDERILDGSPMRVVLGTEPLTMRFTGRPIASVATSPDASAIAKVSFDGSLVVVEPASEGASVPARIVVKTVDGDSYEWGPAVFFVDSGPPSLEIAKPESDQWFKTSIPVALKASDPNGIAAVEWSLDGQSWNAIPLKADGTADAVIQIDSAPDGALALEIRATDKAGKSTLIVRGANKDTAPPTGGVTAPATSEHVNGFITVASGFADPDGSLDRLEFSADGKAWEAFESFAFASRDIELSTVGNDPKRVMFRATDKAGNATVATPDVAIDGELDLPVVRIQLPEENEVLRADFEISGVVTDDDGIGGVYYKLDGGPEVELKLEGGYSFSIPIALLDTTDNEHSVEMYAKDIYGVAGPRVTRKYRVSKAEPVASLENPPIETTVKGVIEIQGTSSDANGIDRVKLSVDNSNTYELVDGTEKWKYRFDTRALADGLHSLYVRPVDKYETEGFFASLINIDNTDPQIILDQPADGSEASGTLNLSGRVYDAVSVKSVLLEFNRIGSGASAPAGAAPQGKTSLALDLGLDVIITRGIDINELADGVYNLRIRVLDKADNYAMATRTVTVVRQQKADAVDLMYPLKGESITGFFSVQGRARTEKPVAAAKIIVDGAEIGEAPINEDGFFSLQVDPSVVADGDRSLVARIVNEKGETVSSAIVPVSYARNGPWISVDNYKFGDYLPYRPYLEGRAGWYDEGLESADKATRAKAQKDRQVESVELSFDNGRTFLKAKGGEKWRFRMETQEYPEGAQYIVIKAVFADGTKTIVRTTFNLDKTSPKVTLLAPRENERINDKVSLIGTASDETKLGVVETILRPGDKAGYEVPAFIKGLFLDGHGFGATYYEVGAGLNFITDDIKLMGFYGQGMENMRYGGTVFGGKLIANLAYLPFGFLLGPDFDWLSANLAVGANFTYFTETQSGEGLMLAAIIAQLEFPVVTLSKFKFFRKHSFYGEFQLWIVPSDVAQAGGFIPKVGFGVRSAIF